MVKKASPPSDPQPSTDELKQLHKKIKDLTTDLSLKRTKLQEQDSVIHKLQERL